MFLNADHPISGLSYNIFDLRYQSEEETFFSFTQICETHKRKSIVFMCCNSNSIQPMAFKREIEDGNKEDEVQRSRKRQRKSIGSVRFDPSPITIEFQKFDPDTKADVWYSVS